MLSNNKAQELKLRAHVLHLLKPTSLEPVSALREATTMRNPGTASREEPL